VKAGLMAALGSGDTARARRVFEQAAGAAEAGTSLIVLGLADVAMFEGHYAEAIAILPRAVLSDEAQGNSIGAAAKLVTLAEAHAARQDAKARDAAIARLRKLSDQASALVPVARLAIAAGRVGEARAIAAELATRLPAQSRAYGKLVEAEIAMAGRQYLTAIDALNSAQKLADLWLVRFALGLAYFQRGDYPEATSELQKCRDRRGEAMAVFLDDLPSFRYYATLPYWLGRAREMQKLDARPQYQEFLRIRQAATDDPLVDDARKRLGATSG
jgi:tetratricopeptide (TPR) repeat protein